MTIRIIRITFAAPSRVEIASIPPQATLAVDKKSGTNHRCPNDKEVKTSFDVPTLCNNRKMENLNQNLLVPIKPETLKEETAEALRLAAELNAELEEQGVAEEDL